MSFIIFFNNLLARTPFAKPSGAANKLFTKPSAHSRANSQTVNTPLSVSQPQLQPQLRRQRNVEPHMERRRAHYAHPSVVSTAPASSSPPIDLARTQDAGSEETMDGINSLILAKFKRQFPEDGQTRVAPAHGSLVAIVRCGGPKGWAVEIKDPLASEIPNPTKRTQSTGAPLPSGSAPALSQQQLEVIEGLNRMLVKKYKKTLPENGQVIMVPAHGAVMARVRCGGPDGWAAQINPDLDLQVV